MVLERLLRVPWTARRSNQSILKEISPKYSLKGLMLKLKLQYFGHLMWRTDSLEKTLMLGKIEGKRWRGLQTRRWLDGASPTQRTWVWVCSESWWWTGKPGLLQSMRSKRAGHDWATELNWWILWVGVKALNINSTYFFLTPETAAVSSEIHWYIYLFRTFLYIFI